MSWTRYVALGDSMSVDLYPALDAGETDVAVALERVPEAGAVAPLGAASLLYRNDDVRWPEDAGDDLSTRLPVLEMINLATPGATIGEVFGEQLTRMGDSDEPTLVTLTVGADDLFSSASSRPSRKLLEAIVHDTLEAYELLIGAIRRQRPESTIVLTTVYDPSDATRRVPNAFDADVPLPLEALRTFNAGLRTMAAATRDTVLADVYAHFLGHGVSAPEPEQWYWRRSLVEPNARGASEIRKVWRDALRPALDDA